MYGWRLAENASAEQRSQVVAEGGPSARRQGAATALERELQSAADSSTRANGRLRGAAQKPAGAPAFPAT